jgi:hypothetical protein
MVKGFITVLLFIALRAQAADLYLRTVIPGPAGDMPGSLVKIDPALLRVDASGNYLLGPTGSLVAYTVPSANPTNTGIVLNSGSDLQKAVDANPEGTNFYLTAGLYRLQSIRPKNRDVFIGDPGATLSGARLLTSFERQGAYWVATQQTQQGQLNGQCDSSHPRCTYPEDLFFDDKPLTHVAALEQVTAGKWFFDYAADRIYFADDPTGHRVETSVLRSSFSGPAVNVTIRGLTIEKYASPAQMGAIGDQYPGAGWIIDSNQIRWNHGLGVNVAANGQILKNNIHHNGQMGMGGMGDNILVEGNEAAFNNYAGYDSIWEAGGSKFVKTNHLIVRNNNSHDNLGSGLWTDIDNINTLYEGNTVTNNLSAGITHEISYAAIIRNNVVRGNGYRTNAWLWDAQIQVQNSQNVEVFGNTIVVPATGGNGIVLSQQDRGTGAYGPYKVLNNKVHNNSVTYLGSSGASGAVADDDSATMFAGGNLFDSGNYHITDMNSPHWAWNNALRTWSDFRAQGQELSGTADTTIP